MKNLTLLTLTFIFSFNSIAQVIVNDVNINDLPDVKYIQMVAMQKGLSATKVVITIDYGQKSSWGDDTRIAGNDKKALVFNSNIDALNFLNRNGWEFVNSFPVTGQYGTVYHYLLKRKDESQVK